MRPRAGVVLVYCMGFEFHILAGHGAQYARATETGIRADGDIAYNVLYFDSTG